MIIYLNVLCIAASSALVVHLWHKERAFSWIWIACTILNTAAVFNKLIILGA